MNTLSNGAQFGFRDLATPIPRPTRSPGYPVILLTLLALGAALSGLNFSVAGRNVRLDHVASVLLAVKLTVEVVFGRRRLFIDGAAVALGGYLLVTAFSSAISAPNPSNSLLQTLNVGTVSVIYLWLINILRSRRTLDRCMHMNFVVAIGAIGLGVLLYLSELVGLTVSGRAGLEEGAIQFVNYGAFGTMREPNIFGSYAALFFVLGLATASGKSYFHDVRLVSRVRMISGIGLILSFTRASWIGVGVVILPLLVGLRQRLRWRLILSLATITVVGIGIAGSPLVPGDYLEYKILNLVNFNSPTAAGRLDIWIEAMRDFPEHPWFGWGCYSFGDMHGTAGGDRMLRPWIGNFAVTVLHDSGLIGASLFALFLGINIVGGLRASKQLWRVEPTAAVRLVGLVYGVSALLVAFLATTGFSFGYPWIALGLIGAYRRRARALLRSHRLTEARFVATGPRTLKA